MVVCSQLGKTHKYPLAMCVGHSTGTDVVAKEKTLPFAKNII
jgi:hypothetical protein